MSAGDRIAARPLPDDWGEDEPMRLDEAVAVFAGKLPISVALLRTEIAKGRLVPARVAGKFFVTPAQLRELFRPCRVSPKVPASICAPADLILGPKPRSPTSTSSEMDRLKGAQDAALTACTRLSARSRATSPARIFGKPPRT
jgi:hypothetical protein